MLIFIFSVAVVLCVWGLCSLAEASLYAVPMPYVRQFDKTRSGKILVKFKTNMEQPISAILIVNTAVAAAGASFAGAQASQLFGEANLWSFSLCFTVAALFISEIIPKILGVVYNRSLSRLLARPVMYVVYALYPFIWIIERTSKLMKPRVAFAIAPEKEVQQLAEISAEEGSIMPYEADLVRHVLDLDKVVAKDIMTPSSVVLKFAENMLLGEVRAVMSKCNFSRVPIHKPEEEGIWTGMILVRDVLAALLADRDDESLASLAKPLFFVPESAPGHKLLSAFLKRRTHMFGVMGGRGRAIGVVTLEDVLESVIGAEIVDELDAVIDMQQFARQQKQ